MFQIQNEQSRAAAEETRRHFGFKKRRFEDSDEERPDTSGSRKKRLNEAHLQHTAANPAVMPFQADQVRGAPSFLQLQHDTRTSEQSRELGFSYIQESAGAVLSGRQESGTVELQNTMFFPSSSNFQVVDSNFNSFRDQVISTRNSNVFINVDRPKNNETVFVRVPTGDGSEVRPEVSNIEITSLKQPLQIRKSSEIYYRHLLTLGRGSPLWIPEPSTSLPIEYQKAGIGIGDVGILKESGEFDFLFNVYQPCNDANHPINPRTMPDGFVPLCPPEERDVNSHVEFKNHSFLASSHVDSRHEESSGLIFESSAEDGAILTMPKGANSIDLDNMGMVRKYISKNVHKWYMYANEVIGRNAGNGDVRVVIGKTSATTWGMATFARGSDEGTPSCLKFKPTRSGTGNEDSAHDASSPNYRWEYSGNMKAEVKSGPDDHEIEKLRKFDRLRGGGGQIAYENQCLFVRTINVTLQERRKYPRDLRQPQANYGPDNFSSLDVGRPKFAEYDEHEWQPAQPSRNPIAPAKHRDSRDISIDEENELVALPPISRLFEIVENNVGTGVRGQAQASGSILPEATSAPLIPVNIPRPDFASSQDCGAGLTVRRHGSVITRSPPILVNTSTPFALFRNSTTHHHQIGPSNSFPPVASGQPGMPQNAYTTYSPPQQQHQQQQLQMQMQQHTTTYSRPHHFHQQQHTVREQHSQLHSRSGIPHSASNVPKPAQSACDSCRRHKIRCDFVADSDPPCCQQCKQHGFQCSFSIPLLSYYSGANNKQGASLRSAGARSFGSKPTTDASYFSYAKPPQGPRSLSHHTEVEASEVGDQVRRGSSVPSTSSSPPPPRPTPGSFQKWRKDQIPRAEGPAPSDKSSWSWSDDEPSPGPNSLSLQRNNEASEVGDQVRRGGSAISPSWSPPPPQLSTPGPVQKVRRGQIPRADGPALPVYKGGDGDGRTAQKSESHVALPVTLELNAPPDSSPPLPGHLHPSKIINEYLLSCAPTATMAITEDGDWISVLQESDIAFPADDVLLSRIRKMYFVGFEEGVVFLRKRMPLYSRG